jgi:hypothetical protein
LRQFSATHTPEMIWTTSKPLSSSKKIHNRTYYGKLSLFLYPFPSKRTSRCTPRHFFHYTRSQSLYAHNVSSDRNPWMCRVVMADNLVGISGSDGDEYASGCLLKYCAVYSGRWVALMMTAVRTSENVCLYIPDYMAQLPRRKRLRPTIYLYKIQFNFIFPSKPYSVPWV